MDRLRLLAAVSPAERKNTPRSWGIFSRVFWLIFLRRDLFVLKKYYA